MNDKTQLLNWGMDYLISQGYTIVHQPEIVLTTPWSNILRFSTSIGNFYLKQTPSPLFLSNEPSIIRLLSNQFHACVPSVMDINDNLHCFIMKDAGKPLREILKEEFRPKLLGQAIEQYAAIQRSTENDITMFLKFGVPDWRLNKLPILYDQLINQTDFLNAEGLTDQELQRLRSLSPQFLAQCELLSSFGIPETIGYHDFHDKNVLFDSKTKRMTFVDWSETAIIHPFFSLQTCLEQVITHHGIKEDDQIYRNLQDACFENWLGLATKTELLKVFILAKEIREIWNVLANYQFMLSLDLQAYRAYYPNRLSPIAVSFRKYINDANSKI